MLAVTLTVAQAGAILAHWSPTLGGVTLLQPLRCLQPA